MTRGYRTPEQMAADCLLRAERFEQSGKSRIAAGYRALAAEQPALAVRIDAAMSRQERETSS